MKFFITALLFTVSAYSATEPTAQPLPEVSKASFQTSFSSFFDKTATLSRKGWKGCYVAVGAEITEQQKVAVQNLGYQILPKKLAQIEQEGIALNTAYANAEKAYRAGSQVISDKNQIDFDAQLGELKKQYRTEVDAIDATVQKFFYLYTAGTLRNADGSISFSIVMQPFLSQGQYVDFKKLIQTKPNEASNQLASVEVLVSGVHSSAEAMDEAITQLASCK